LLRMLRNRLQAPCDLYSTILNTAVKVVKDSDLDNLNNLNNLNNLTLLNILNNNIYREGGRYASTGNRTRFLIGDSS